MLSLLFAAFLFQAQAASPGTNGDTAHPPAAIPADAYMDANAGLMIAAARGRTDLATRGIQAYEVTARQRTAVGLTAFRRDRMLFRREIAARVGWSRTGERRMEVLGAREVTPASRGAEAMNEDELESEVRDLLLDPRGEWLLRVRGLDEDEDDDAPLIHPLALGSETHYRYRTGETTTIQLATGERIRLIELQVIPRRSAANLLSGSLWLEEESYAPVRGVFSMAAPARLSTEIDFGSIPFPVPDATVNLDYVTEEYGLWENEWWLPRLMAVEGSATIGGLRVPVTFEQSYSDYEIYATAAEWPGFPPPDTTNHRALVRECPEDEEDCPTRIVLVPRDSSLLVDSPYFPESIYSAARLMTEAELRQMGDLLAASGSRALSLTRPRVDWNRLDATLLHYNRVEGLTLGTRARIDAPPFSLSGAAWLGFANRSPGFDLELGRARLRGREAIGVYRRLDAFAPDDRPFSLGSSISAFAFGRDDGDYYQALGARVVSEHGTGAAALRTELYLERQDAVEKETDASLAHWLREATFRENPAANAAEQVGADATLSLSRGTNPVGFRGRLEARVRAERGTFDFTRPAIRAFTSFPLPGKVIGALEAAVGTAYGELPLQREWALGGAATVRGFRAEERITGDTFWSARAEIATDIPAARLILFSDAGWAGERDAFATDPELISAGIGASLLDGFLRADLTRALRGGDHWGFQLYLDAPL